MHLIRATVLSLAGALGATAVLAADLPQRTSPPAPVFDPVPVTNWTGFYAGVNAGVAWGAGCATTVPVLGGVTVGWANPGCGTGGNSNASFAGGGQIGYNYQMSNLVFGVEADLQGLGNGNNANSFTTVTAGLPGFLAGNFQVNNAHAPNVLWTLRGRVGFVVDKSLIYLTGGFAGGSGSRSHSVSYWPGPVTGAPLASWSGGSNGSSWGWSLGLGAEYALTPRWSIKAEYLLAGLTVANRSVSTCAGVSCTAFSPALTWINNKRNTYENIARIGVNYAFSR